ncbi:neutral/alkaline non-lysosomal ceramidase N-terminal domain-containing protein [Dietzia natronolimnaea]|uniref:neutral/alkaline non-lysosomal ceramidase N-terminal domain-containing protein n=1 Tax=Dietzia natronolimnaea TaxID=161920 RepID=UPI0015F9C72D|nr:neutral/alkaline non-lysosomal ceramidase N-terminal domain-containing protein [Dietzia natronolimnaea]MBB1037888.1 neutral/alkaline ceramidase [Dietzia natronolimnaea]
MPMSHHVTDRHGAGHRGIRRRTVLGGAAALGSVVALHSVLPAVAPAQATRMYVGRGIGDMTGESLGAGMNGYADTEQHSVGLHLRQRARAFVFADSPSSPRFVHVTAEIGLIFQSIQQEVLRRLSAEFGDTYHEGNVVITATHTHAAPGGTSGHPMVDLSMLGFRPVTFDANCAGIVDAVRMAHHDLAPSSVGVTTGHLYDAGVNRSRGSFDRDTADERAHFPTGIDPRSQSLQITRGERLVGVINWFASHATSMTAANALSSSDNKGYAAWYWEREAAGQDYLAGGTPALVTAFAQTNPGDVSPNLDLEPGRGPTPDEWLNTRINGERQFAAARDQVGRNVRPLGGGIDVRHRWVDMSGVDVRPEFTGDGRTHRTAVAALGAAFAAGSQEDGGGAEELPFNEGDRGGNPEVRAISELVIPAWLREAHGAKDVLLPVGLVPHAIQRVYPFHLVRLGGHYLFSLGFEPTVVAGLRLRRTLAAELAVPEDHITVQGYSNAYGHYVTTPEEYSAQNYEGGATAFGPWTLPAIQQVAADLARSMRSGSPLDPGASERDLTGQIPVSPLGTPLVDTPAPLRNFGDVLDPPLPGYRVGQRVVVRFCGTNPNSDLRRGDTYLAVERRDGGRWVRVHDDGDWSTMIVFEGLLTVTNALITWDIPPGTPAGEYRVVYTASGRGIDGRLFPVRGESPAFDVR